MRPSIPDWGPPIDGLNMDDIVTYVRPNTKMSAKWSEVPHGHQGYLRKVWASRRRSAKSLAGVGAQYDSELVYHNVKEEVAAAGRGLHRYGERHERANMPIWCASIS